MTRITGRQKSGFWNLGRKTNIVGAEDEDEEDEEAIGRQSSMSRQSKPRKKKGNEFKKQELFPDIEDCRRKCIQDERIGVQSLYHETGIFQKIARSSAFETTTLFVIGVNAVWLWVDTDMNKAETLLTADTIFQVMDNVFCFYFLAEIVIRFGAFASKRSCLTDSWFLFDSLLAVSMIFDTWVMTLVEIWIGMSSPEENNKGVVYPSSFKLLKLLKLMRMARIARLLSAVPELVILVKGMIAAARSVFFTLCLLLAVVYAFGIGFVQLCDGTGSGELYFKTVPDAMYTLVLQGTFLDEITALVADMRKDTDIFALCFLFFVLVTGYLVMNMLIGVLCEVVSVISETEKFDMMVQYLRHELKEELHNKGFPEKITQQVFTYLLQCDSIIHALEKVSIDPFELVKLADTIYESNAVDTDGCLTLDNMMFVVLQFRGSNKATVKDLIELRKALSVSFQPHFHQLDQLDSIYESVSRIEHKILGLRVSGMDDSALLLGSAPPRQKFKIRVKIIGAKGLPNRDQHKAGDLSDPYAVIELASSGKLSMRKERKPYKTKIMYNTLNPIWNSPPFDFVDVTSYDFIHIRVYDRDPDKTKDEFLGMAVFPCKLAFPRGFEGDLELQCEGPEETNATVQVKVAVPALHNMFQNSGSPSAPAIATSSGKQSPPPESDNGSTFSSDTVLNPAPTPAPKPALVKFAVGNNGEPLMREPAEEPAEEPSVAQPTVRFATPIVTKQKLELPEASKPVALHKSVADTAKFGAAAIDSTKEFAELKACMARMESSWQESLMRGTQQMMSLLKSELDRRMGGCDKKCDGGARGNLIGAAVYIVGTQDMNLDGKRGVVVDYDVFHERWKLMMSDGSGLMLARENFVLVHRAGSICGPGIDKCIAGSPVENEQISIGARVRVVGVSSVPDLNGQQGQVIGIDSQSGAWKVLMDDGSGKILAKGNLEVCSGECVDSSSSSAAAGERVRIVGLESRPELNGSLGTMVSWDSSTRRWRVSLDDGNATLVRPENLEVSSQPGARLAPGVSVRVVGLRSRSDLNGESGVISRWDEQQRRWRVTLDSGLRVLAKPDNLELQQLDCPSQSQPVWLSPGCRVRVRNLKTAIELNGREGAVVDVDKDATWVSVRLDGGSCKQLRKENLEEGRPKLMVTIRGAFLAGQSAPVCVCEVPGKPASSIRTHAPSSATDPIWGFKGLLSGVDDSDVLHIRVFDKTDKSGVVLLGSGSLGAADFLPHGCKVQLPLAAPPGQQSASGATNTIEVEVEVLGAQAREFIHRDMRVRIVDLRCRPELNERCGSTLEWDEQQSRWRVQLDDGSGILVKPLNLTGVGSLPSKDSPERQLETGESVVINMPLEDIKLAPPQAADPDTIARVASRLGVAAYGQQAESLSDVLSRRLAKATGATTASLSSWIKALRRCKVPVEEISDEQAGNLFAELDLDGSGNVDIATVVEFAQVSSGPGKASSSSTRVSHRLALRAAKALEDAGMWSDDVLAPGVKAKVRGSHGLPETHWLPATVLSFDPAQWKHKLELDSGAIITAGPSNLHKMVSSMTLDEEHEPAFPSSSRPPSSPPSSPRSQRPIEFLKRYLTREQLEELRRQMYGREARTYKRRFSEPALSSSLQMESLGLGDLGPPKFRSYGLEDLDGSEGSSDDQKQAPTKDDGESKPTVQKRTRHRKKKPARKGWGASSRRGSRSDDDEGK